MSHHSLFVGLLLFCCSFALPAAGREESTSLTSLGEAPGVTREDLLHLLSQETGGELLMGELLLAYMEQEELRKLVEQLTDTLLLERAARISGLDLREDLRLRMRWSQANLLARAYVEKLEEHWDLSGERLQEYYEFHQDRYIQEMELCLVAFYYATEEDARSALMGSLGTDPLEGLGFSKFTRQVPLGWMVASQAPPEYEKAFSSPETKTTLGPFETPRGEYVLLFVENRLDSRKLSFEEAREKVLGDLETDLLEEELRELRRRFNVKFHERSIRGLQPYEF